MKMKIWNIITIIAILVTSQAFLYSHINSPIEYKELDFEVVHYQAELDLTDAPNNYVIGKNNIKYAWKNDNKYAKFYFHLYDLTIDSIKYNGINIQLFTDEIYDSTLNYTHKYYFVERISDEVSDTVELTIYYQGEMTYAPNNKGWAGVNSISNVLPPSLKTTTTLQNEIY